MKEKFVFQVGEKLRILDEDGNQVEMTCVENPGCSGCSFKRLPGGKPGGEIRDICKSVACCYFERPDRKGVVFQAIKEKEEGK